MYILVLIILFANRHQWRIEGRYIPFSAEDLLLLGPILREKVGKSWKKLEKVWKHSSVLDALRAYGCTQMRQSIGSWGHWCAHMKAFLILTEKSINEKLQNSFSNINPFCLVNYKLFLVWRVIMCVKYFEIYAYSKFSNFWSFRFDVATSTLISFKKSIYLYYIWICCSNISLYTTDNVLLNIYLQIEPETVCRKVVHIIMYSTLSLQQPDVSSYCENK